MTIETRYEVDGQGGRNIVCESYEDALAIAASIVYVPSYQDSDRQKKLEEQISEVSYLPDTRKHDDEDEDTIHPVLLHHAHDDDEGGDSDD